ncbi:hypothetical protein D9M72_577340 [compost metagenome]
MTSSTGRVMLRTTRLLATRMPMGMPMTTETIVAISISASVCIVRSQRPSTPTKNRRTPTTTVRPQRLELCQASAMKMRMTTHQGRPRRIHSMNRTAFRMTALIALKTQP